MKYLVAVFAAVFSAEAALALGAAVRSDDGDWYTAFGFVSQENANAAAIAACVAGDSAATCPTITETAEIVLIGNSEVFIGAIDDTELPDGQAVHAVAADLATARTNAGTACNAAVTAAAASSNTNTAFDIVAAACTPLAASTTATEVEICGMGQESTCDTEATVIGDCTGDQSVNDMETGCDNPTLAQCLLGIEGDSNFDGEEILNTAGDTCVAASDDAELQAVCEGAGHEFTAAAGGTAATCTRGVVTVTPDPVTNTVTNTVTRTVSDDDNEEWLYAVGGGVVVAGLAWFLSDGFAYGEFAFSPDAGFSATESGYSYNVGGKLDFHRDNWHLYWATGENGGDLQYGTGGSYTADVWKAAFSETVSGETADYDLSLSADWKNGIWKFSPTYRLHSEFADGEFDTDNSLNLESVVHWNRWTINPSAGFAWENEKDFGDNAKFRINAVHRF